jgi:hypothetical protein
MVSLRLTGAVTRARGFSAIASVTVDHKETADRIILAKDGPKAGGQPHLISITWVDCVNEKIHLDKPSKKAMMEWQVAA